MIRFFTRHHWATVGLAMILSLTTLEFACQPPSWVQVALNDLPAIIQIAQAIIGLVNGAMSSPEDQAKVKAISDEAVKDLNLLLGLYNTYAAHPTADAKAAIEKAGAEILQNLPALLESAHIKNAALLARVTSAVTMVITLVSVVLSLVPNPTNAAIKDVQAKKKGAKIPSPQEIINGWNTDICRGEAACTVK